MRVAVNVTARNLNAAAEWRDPSEGLHAELVPHLSEHEALGPILKAPLVFMVPYLPSLAAFANEMYLGKKAALRRAEQERRWSKAVWLYERPYRLLAFFTFAQQLSDSEYWQLLGSIWLDTESLFQNQELWLQALTADRAARADWLMDEQDRAVLNALDEEVTIHRGFTHGGGQRSPSWSVSRRKAEWFAARRFGVGTSYLASTTIRRDQALAYFGGRGEQEIVIDPCCLTDVRVTALG